MKNFLLFFSLFSTTFLFGQFDNHCLDFDGIEDQITLWPSPLSGSTDFTIETWFLSSATDSDMDCATNFRKLVSLNSEFETVDVGLCSGYLNLGWTINNVSDTVQSIAVSPNQWQHLAIVREVDTTRLFLNCVEVLRDTIEDFVVDTFRIGQGIHTATPLDNWQGQVDEIRMWNHMRSKTDLEAHKNCVLIGNESGLLLYWQLDQGVASGANSAIEYAIDETGNGQNGLLDSFDLTGSTSNFIASNAGLVYPNYNRLAFDISDADQTGLITEIGKNTPIHFCLSYDDAIPQATGDNTITWQYNDGAGWLEASNLEYVGFCSVIRPDHVAVDCSDDNLDGYVDRAYRAIVEVRDPILEDTCFYTTDTDTLRICCPISETTMITLSVDSLCGGDTTDVTVTLLSDEFVLENGPTVNIHWDTNGVALTGLADSTSFVLADVAANFDDICFNVTITNCGGKSKTASKCIHVDPMPICGTITGRDMPDNLIQDATNANLYYICPENDASLDTLTPFINCIPQWEYTFNLEDWHPLGYSNTIQNTNVLPTPYWEDGATSIFYRIACQPFSTPSICMPCFGDTLEIQLLPAPDTVEIVGTSPICLGSNTLLSISSPQMNAVLPITYTWLHNGLVVGTGETYQAAQNGCYWVEASDGCQVSPSAPFCLEVCELEAIISCPLLPNECAYQGQSITLSGCGSHSSCDNASLTYQWTYDSGTLIQSNDCTIEHLPDPSGTTYTLTVTDTANGCTDTTNRFVKPCAN